MEPRTKIVTVQLDDGSSVKFIASDLGGSKDVADLEKILPFKEVTDTIEVVAKAVLATLHKATPDKASVEFGVEVGIESGKLTALIVKGTGTANLKITLEWSKGVAQA
jgi:hypothetical protein